MASPDFARVIVDVGFPPFLYKDVLCLRSRGTWWIVAKSSRHVPFLANEASGCILR